MLGEQIEIKERWIMYHLFCCWIAWNWLQNIMQRNSRKKRNDLFLLQLELSVLLILWNDGFVSKWLNEIAMTFLNTALFLNQINSNQIAFQIMNHVKLNASDIYLIVNKKYFILNLNRFPSFHINFIIFSAFRVLFLFNYISF